MPVVVTGLDRFVANPQMGLVFVVLLALLAAACGTPNVAPSPGSAQPFAALSAVPASLTSSPGPSAPGASLGPTAASGLSWTSCTSPFECATLAVPINYAQPGAVTINLALIRLPATDPSQRIGDLVTNPGGPGASGVDFVRQAGQGLFSAALRARFDIIGFDPRGVGRSHPISCVDGAELDRLAALDPFPDTPAEKAALVAGAQTFAAGCVATSGPLLPFMTTIDAARDMDQIRAALGDPRLTYLGFSYGTFLGSTYANLFPGRVRALVLDGAVDATLSFAASLQTQAEGFAGAFGRFLANCAANPGCPFNNRGAPGPAYDALMARIDASPLRATELGDARLVGPGEALTGVVTGLYDQADWPFLAKALALAQGGDGSYLLELADSLNERAADGSHANIASANAAVDCADTVAPTNVATYDALAVRLEGLAPRFGEADVYTSLNCAFWPFHPSHDPVAPAATGAPPILVIGTTGDPATPYAWAVKLASELSSGILLTRTGEGHTAYGSKSPCIDTLVDSYLLTLAVPKPGTVCS